MINFSRREFVALLGAAAAWGQRAFAGQSATSAPAASAMTIPRPEWLARHVEPILEPDLPIVDAHHHLWQRPGWRYLLDELLADTGGGHNIVATVYMQGGAMHRARGPEEMRPVGEVEFANGVAAMASSGGYGKTLVAAGIVGHADMLLGSRVEPVLHALIRAGGDRLRGIRHRVAWEPEEVPSSRSRPNRSGMLADPAFREGVAVVGRLGLSFDVSLYYPQIAELADFADALPQIRIVLNHVGGILARGSYRHRQAEVFAHWSSAIRALAARPNVYVKLGGMGQAYSLRFDENSEPPSSAQVAARFRPYVDTCIEAFGTSRCMFESNFPVDKISYSYPVFWNACKRLAQGASAAEKADLFAGTAARCYRLDGVV